jgi:hypothetical protein
MGRTERRRTRLSAHCTRLVRLWQAVRGGRLFGALAVLQLAPTSPAQTTTSAPGSVEAKAEPSTPQEWRSVTLARLNLSNYGGRDSITCLSNIYAES